MNYTPNFNDPRVKRRAMTALGFTVGILGAKPRQVFCRDIDVSFGKSNHQMGRWLRERLIICVDTAFNKDTGLMKKYTVNPEGIDLLGRCLDIPPFQYRPEWHVSENQQRLLHYRSYAIEWAEDRWQSQLNTQQFDYRLSSNRYWHGIQNMRSAVRSQLLDKYGLKYNYDIVACAPNLLYQRYLRDNRHVLKLDMSHLQELLTDRSGVRTRVAQQTGASVTDIKTILTAMFCSGRLAANNHCELFKQIGSDYDLMTRIQTNEYVVGLKNDINIMWDGIRHGFPRHLIDLRADGKPKAIEPATKWQIYFEMERQVMDAMTNYTDQRDINTFRIHDCFVSNRTIDTEHLQEYIKKETNYNISIELS